MHNKYLAPDDTFTGDDIAQLLALGFSAPEYEEQNFFRIFQPESDDYAEIIAAVRSVITAYFGLPQAHPLHIR